MPLRVCPAATVPNATLVTVRVDPVIVPVIDASVVGAAFSAAWIVTAAADGLAAPDRFSDSAVRT